MFSLNLGRFRRRIAGFASASLVASLLTVGFAATLAPAPRAEAATPLPGTIVADFENDALITDIDGNTRTLVGTGQGMYSRLTYGATAGAEADVTIEDPWGGVSLQPSAPGNHYFGGYDLTGGLSWLDAPVSTTPYLNFTGATKFCFDYFNASIDGTDRSAVLGVTVYHSGSPNNHAYNVDLTKASGDPTNYGATFTPSSPSALSILNGVNPATNPQTTPWATAPDWVNVCIPMTGVPVNQIRGFRIFMENINNGVSDQEKWGIDNIMFAVDTLDFGDAPASYGTTIAGGGAQHTVTDFDSATSTAPLMIGGTVDGEADGTPSAGADGDGADEDGAASPVATSLTDPSIPITVTNNAATEATLAGWLDLDGDGVFEAGERVTRSIPASSGTTTVEMSFPAGVAANTFARFRLFPGTVADPLPTGAVDGGEVEDYAVTLELPPEPPIGVCDYDPIDDGGWLLGTGAAVPTSLSVTSWYTSGDTLGYYPDQPNGTGPSIIQQPLTGVTPQSTLHFTYRWGEGLPAPGNGIALAIYYGGQMYGTITTPLANNGTATFTSAGGATLTRTTTTPFTVGTLNDFTLDLPAGIPANGTLMLQTGLATNSSATTDDIFVTYLRMETTGVCLIKQAETGAAGTYDFTSTNTSPASAAITVADGQSVAHDADATEDGTQPLAVTAPGQGVTITEAEAAGIRVAEVSCVDLESGQTTTFDPSNTLSIPGSLLPLGTQLECTFVNEATQRALAIDKTSDQTTDTRIGDTVTYTVTATNTGTEGYTADEPATLVDDLTGVLDDATFDGTVEATAGEATYAEPRIQWQGPLAAGDSVTLTYSVVLTGAGDRSVDNVAFGADCVPGEECAPVTPPIAECVDGGTDPVTGLPCDAVSYGLPDLSIGKSADATVVTEDGQSVTYTVTAMNTGTAAFTDDRPAVVLDDLSGVLDDATLDEATLSASIGAAPAFADPLISWSGPLDAGASVTITYTVTFDAQAADGDGSLENVAFAPDCDSSDPTCATDPPTTPVCDPADENGLDPDSGLPCARVDMPSVLLDVQKSSDPTDGSTVQPGDDLTYKITFANTGSAEAAVTGWTDHLTGLVDDATVTVPPASSDAALTVSGIENDQFTVDGAVPAGETITVTYTVTVKPDGQRGDDVIGNVVTPPGVDPPATCEPGDDLCTTHLVPELVASKSVDPASGTTVEPGQELTYTLTFANTGSGAGTVAEVDDLSHLLDDADVTTAPTASDAALTVSAIADDRFSIDGTLQAGETVTVTYVATVLPDGDRGDDIVANFLLPEGSEPPTDPTCAADDPRCTSNPVPELMIAKGASQSTITADGQTITYTVEATNVGAAAYTTENPAVVLDDLTDVLDDATLDEASITSDLGTTPAYAEPLISWAGELAAGQTVTITYTVTYTGAGDDDLSNVAFAPDCAEDDPTCSTPPPTPVCDPADADGIDPATGRPCARVEILAGDLEVIKTADPEDGSTVLPGDVITYTISFINTGGAAADVEGWTDHVSGVTDDAIITGQPRASTDDLIVSTVQDGAFTVTGQVPAGETITVSYTVVVLADGSRGDDVLANFVVPPGQEPPAMCAAGDVLCTVNSVPEITTTKSVNPASGTTVAPGQSLTYTLTFANDGAAAGAVDVVDDLTHLLDDVDIATAPASSDAALSVSEIADGRFGVTGSLEPGQTVTVTYTVTVKADGARGDDLVGNFVLTPDEEPPVTPECTDENQPCTVNPVPEITVAKSVDPASGTTVVAGEELTYTLTFSNDGAAAGSVDVVDDLTHALDDAELTTAPAASDVALSVSDVVDGRFSVTGSLDAGQTVTVTYSLTVKADGTRGDDVVGNFVLSPGEQPPAAPECTDEMQPCTVNPVPELSITKSVDPASGTTVVAGQELTYTLAFANAGAAAAAVDVVDDLTHAMDDAEIATAPAASDAALSASEITDGRFAVTGSLEPGQTVTVTYMVTVKADGERGDDVVGNFLLERGEEPPVTPECTDENQPCTLNLVPEITVAKSVDPASGTSVVTGQQLTYTLTFSNDGAAAGPVDVVDDLTHVLDDADMTIAPVSSDAALTVSEITDGRFAVTGSLAPGQTVTVTYSVTVRADDARGDDDLGNFVLSPDEEPPTMPECTDENQPCTENPVTEVAISKSVDPASGTTVVAGQELTYTLTFANSGATAEDIDVVDDLSHLLDDAAVTSAPVSSDGALTASVILGDRFTITGTLAAGQTVTVAYTVTVKPDGERGDDVVGNFLLEPGEEPPATPECRDENQPCTVNPVPEITVAKTVDPASGATVAAGQELTYTLTFTNDGAATGTVDLVDDLTHLLDDADVSAAPAVSDAALTVSEIADDRFAVAGSLEPGQTVTVTYSVTVRPDGARGDDALGNFVLDPDEEPPTTPECTDEAQPCTVNSVPEVTVTKAVDPASGTTVVAGQQLTYTLTFANDGAAASEIDQIDDLTHVLDDAEITSAPIASDDALTASVILGGQFTITGTLAAGQTVTVTYTVTVLPDGERGDDLVGNFLLTPGQEPPTTPECTDETQPCTVNPVPEITIAKSVDPASGTTVVAGQELTYTLTFSNDGAAAGPVDVVDDLTHVLDDADATSAPVASDAALSVSEIVDDRFAVTGSLEPGQTVTVTYSATVRPEDARGDDDLGNFVLSPDEEPPTTPGCTDENQSCTANPVTEVMVSKSVDPASGTTVVAGQELTYTLSFANSGATAEDIDLVDDLTHLLDDAAVTSAPVSSDDALTASVILGDRFTITGTLAAGQTVTVTYTVTVKPDGERGDDVVGNFLLERGEEPPTTPECTGDRCTVNSVPEIVDVKSSDPASGATVLPGDVITYTLTFRNDGAAAGEVQKVDDLTHVLDDADLASGPTSSDAALTVSAVQDGRFVIAGTLEPGQEVTVSYRVTVRADGDRGDDSLANFLLPPDGTPLAEPVCEEASEDCTVHLVPRIVDSKSADPASGSTVLPGQVVTYTLTFENVGTGSGAVDKVDDLTHVLDDGSLVSEPIASVDTLQVAQVSDTQYAVTGTLAAGTAATVTYQVLVSGAGDQVLANYLLPRDGTPPTEPVCENLAAMADGQTEIDCTVHPVPEIQISKSSDPESGSAVAAGDVITYTLTIRNTGAGDGTVAFTDHLGAVLDDAKLVGQAVSDTDSVTAGVVDDSIVVTGSVAAGATATVTYAVEVLAWEQQGDHIVGNFVTAAGEEPPAVCVEGSSLCTTHRVPEPPMTPGGLAITGGAIAVWLLVTAGLLTVGGGALIAIRRRRQG